MKKMLIAGVVAAFFASNAYAKFDLDKFCSETGHAANHWKCEGWIPPQPCTVEIQRKRGTLFLNGTDKWSRSKNPAHIVVHNYTDRGMTLKVKLLNTVYPINESVRVSGNIGWSEQHNQPMNLFPGHGDTGYLVHPGETNLYFTVDMTTRDVYPAPGRYKQTLEYSCETLY